MSYFDRAAEILEQLEDLSEDQRRVAVEALADEPEEVLALLGPMLGGQDTPTPAFDVPRAWDDRERALPESIGPYRILGVLGEGGMGRVFEARQEPSQRLVALKVIRGSFANEGQRQRFATEAQALARLGHPGIATVYETGTASVHGQECPYLAMERVEGETLDAYLAHNSPSLSERVDLIIRVCDALHHAHQKGVVHRDLKPANILVDAEGNPKLLDFGIARIAEDEGQTATGQLLGTLAYMSPEQFAGDSTAIDQRTDVYALGVLLYETLSERRPFELAGLPLHEAARVVSQEDPHLLGGLDARLRGDLETIAARALESERQRRYSSAADLAADLRRFLDHEPVEARPRTTIYKLRKFTRRNRWVVAGSLSTFAALMLGLVGTVSAAVRAEGRAEQALVARALALDSAQRASAAEEHALVAADEAREAEARAREQEKIALAIRDLFLRVLGTARPAVARGRSITVIEALAAANEEVGAVSLGDPEVELEILTTLARVQSSLDEHSLSSANTDSALVLARDQFGAGSLQYRDLLQFSAMTAANNGRAGEAERILREVLAGSGLLAEDAIREPDIADFISIGQMGNIEHRRGNFALAIEMSKSSVAGLRNYPGEHVRHLISELVRLSAHYMFVGERELELETAREALELGREFGYENLKRPLMLDQQYANALDDIGRTAEAIPIYEAAIVKALQWYGAEHPETAELPFNLALALTRVGRTEEAFELLMESHERISRLFGPSKGLTMLVFRELLLCYSLLGRSEEGLVWSDAHMHEVSNTYRGALVRMARGQLLAEIGLYEDALDLCVPALARASTSLPLGHPHLTKCLKVMISSYDGLGREADASATRETLERHLAARGAGDQ